MGSLDRGLQILELIAQKGVVPFSVLLTTLPDIPKASFARILKELLTSGHLDKTEAGYRCGDRMGIFASLRAPNRHDDLIARWQQPMQDLADGYGITTLLLERVGDVPICIHRCLTDYSPSMQPIGFRNHQASQIWQQMLIAAAPEVQNRLLAQHPEIEPAIAAWGEQGYADDTCSFRPDLRRLAFPLYDRSGGCIGVLGMGGSPHQITDALLPIIVDEVKHLINERV